VGLQLTCIPNFIKIGEVRV